MTLQQHFNLIKEGKGNKDQFLKQAKSLFPQYFNQYTDFNTATNVLKSKQIISEAAGGVVAKGFDIFDWKKILENLKPEDLEIGKIYKYSGEITMGSHKGEKITGELKFEKKIHDDMFRFIWTKIDNINAPNARVGRSFQTNKTGLQYLTESVKSIEKETSKEVLDNQKNTYNNSDMKNADNVNFNEIMKGFFAEMYDEKNHGKTGDEIKAMVVKNLGKDPLYYTKNGNFSTMGVGYTTEAPGLGEPKTPKGKHKSSGYGDLKENKEKRKLSLKQIDGKDKKGLALYKNTEDSDDLYYYDGKVLYSVVGGDKKGPSVRMSLFNITGLKENKETPDEKIAKYEKYTYTLDGKKVKPDDIAFYDNILGIEIDGEVYRPGTPDEKGNIELKSRKGKTGIYTEGVKEMSVAPQNSKGVKRIPMPGKEKKIKLQESFFLNLEDAKEEAQRVSKEEGVVQHVNIDGEGYNVEDWYDSDNTVASYENGRSLNEIVYQGPSVGGPSMPGEKGRRFIPNVTVLSREAVDNINDRGRTRVGWNKPHIKIVKSGENIKLQVSQPLLDVISGSQRGNFAGSSLQSKMGTGLTSEDTKMLSGEFKKLLRVLNAAGKLSKTGDYYLIDLDTTYNPKRDQFELPLPKTIQEISDIDLSQYNSMSDHEIIRWAKDDGMEEMIIMDPEGGLVNREEILLALLGTEGMGEEETMDDLGDEKDMWGPDDIDPAGGRGPSSHMEESLAEQKLRSLIRNIIKEELNEYGEDSGGQDMTWGMYKEKPGKLKGGNQDFIDKGYEDYYDGIPFNGSPYDSGKNKYYGGADLTKLWQLGWKKAEAEDKGLEFIEDESNIEDWNDQTGDYDNANLSEEINNPSYIAKYTAGEFEDSIIPRSEKFTYGPDEEGTYHLEFELGFDSLDSYTPDEFEQELENQIGGRHSGGPGQAFSTTYISYEGEKNGKYIFGVHKRGGYDI